MEHTQHDLLLTRMRADDRSALRTIFEQHYRMVCSVIRRYIHDPGLEEDMAQEVFVRFWEKRHQIAVESNLSAYLRRMAVNEALAHLRRKTRFAPDELPEQLPAYTAGAADEQLHASEMQKAIDRAIAALPDRCRLIFQLSRHEDMSYREIADNLEISIKTVENQMGKALRVLREELAAYL